MRKPRNYREHYSTSNQERQLFALDCNGVIEHPKPEHLDSKVRAYELLLNSEVVTVFVPWVVAHHSAVKALKQAGLVVLSDDGIKIVYA